MLDQNFAISSDSFQSCDTTTNGNISTPFLVRDILNISNESEFVNGYNNIHVKDYQNSYDNCNQLYHQQNWENSYVHPYEHYNYNLHNYVDIKVECDFDKQTPCNFDNQHMQNLNSFCAAYPPAYRDAIEPIKLESPSKFIHIFF